MSWIRHLTVARALLIACVWPTALILIPAAALGVGWIYSRWTDWRHDGSEAYVFGLHVLHWPRAFAILFAPPVMFLLVWWLGRLSDRAP